MVRNTIEIEEREERLQTSARKKAESRRKIEKQEEKEMLRLTLQDEKLLPGSTTLPPPEPAKMQSWVEPWRDECSQAVTLGVS